MVYPALDNTDEIFAHYNPLAVDDRRSSCDEIKLAFPTAIERKFSPPRHSKDQA